MTATEKKIVVLFDEFGLPTFKNTNTSNFFVGVSALYELSDEDKIFNAVDKLMGLSEPSPLKNNIIDRQLAVDIARCLGEQNIHVTAKWLELNNATLVKSTEHYIMWSNGERTMYREVDERKIAHFLHKYVEDYCLLDVISRFLETVGDGIFKFEIFIDNWNYPNSDMQIMLEDSPESLQQRIQELHKIDMKTDIQIFLESIKFLSSSSDKRKRFIDILTSVISRSFYHQNNPKFDLQPLKELRKGLGNKFVVENTTSELIEFSRYFMAKYSRHNVGNES